MLAIQCVQCSPHTGEPFWRRNVSYRGSGSGDLTIDQGDLEHFTINRSGVGNVKAGNVTTKELDYTLSGHSRVVIGRVLGPSRERVSPFRSLKILA